LWDLRIGREEDYGDLINTLQISLAKHPHLNTDQWYVFDSLLHMLGERDLFHKEVTPDFLKSAVLILTKHDLSPFTTPDRSDI
jgi:hypothetical protein